MRLFSSVTKVISIRAVRRNWLQLPLCFAAKRVLMTQVCVYAIAVVNADSKPDTVRCTAYFSRLYALTRKKKNDRPLSANWARIREEILNCTPRFDSDRPIVLHGRSNLHTLSLLMRCKNETKRRGCFPLERTMKQPSEASRSETSPLHGIFLSFPLVGNPECFASTV